MHPDHRQRPSPEHWDDVVADGVQVLEQVAFRGVGAIEQRVIEVGQGHACPRFIHEPHSPVQGLEGN
jgi:hypothetical protein